MMPLNQLTALMDRSTVQDMSPRSFPNDLDSNPKQVTRTQLHKHSHSTVAIDFDGVLNKYSRYEGRGVFGKPLPEGIRLVKQLITEGFYVVILTARPEIDLVTQWLNRQGISGVQVTNTKPPALFYVDDNGYRWGDKPREAEKVMRMIRKKRGKKTVPFFPGR